MESAVVCPPEADISPSNCGEDLTNKPNTILLNCYAQNLNDSRWSDILDIFLATPGISPLGWLNLMLNQLSRDPSNLVHLILILI